MVTPNRNHYPCDIGIPQTRGIYWFEELSHVSLGRRLYAVLEAVAALSAVEVADDHTDETFMWDMYVALPAFTLFRFFRQCYKIVRLCDNDFNAFEAALARARLG
jgi:hypothetical protein